MSTPASRTTLDRTYFQQNVPYARLLGIDPGEIGDGRATFRLTVEERHLRPMEMAHGGAIASLMDMALSMAAVSVAPPGVYAVTAQLSLNYTRPARLGETLIAQGECQHRGSRTAVVRGEIRNGEGKLIATGSATMIYLPLSDPAPGP